MTIKKKRGKSNMIRDIPVHDLDPEEKAYLLKESKKYWNSGGKR